MEKHREVVTQDYEKGVSEKGRATLGRHSGSRAAVIGAPERRRERNTGKDPCF